MNILNDFVTRLNERMVNPERNTDLLLEELKNLGVEFINTPDKECWDINEQKETVDHSDKHESKALHIADVSGMLHIDFGIWLTGHNKETIEQMFTDWEKRQ